MLNQIHCENCTETMARMPSDFLDLTVTSPPYDDLRAYKGYEFDVEAVADALYRVTKPGGVVVWVVNDKTVDGDETGTSFRHALTFKAAGFKLWDTMIWEKPNPTPMDTRILRYTQAFEYMFVFTKGAPKTCNHIRVPCVTAGIVDHNNYPARRQNGNKSSERVVSKTPAVRFDKPLSNVWRITASGEQGEYAIQHPAVFPLQLAKDQISSWSNEGDVVYDCFGGSMTTAVAAHQLGRRWIMSEISNEYCELGANRLEPYLAQRTLFGDGAEIHSDAQVDVQPVLELPDSQESH